MIRNPWFRTTGEKGRDADEEEKKLEGLYL